MTLVAINPLIALHRIKVHFKDSKGNHLKTIEANEGDDLLSIAHEHDIDLEGAPRVHLCLAVADLSDLHRSMRGIRRMFNMSRNSGS